MTPVMFRSSVSAEALADDEMSRSDGLGNAPDVPAAFLSRGEVARLFGVVPSTVTRWARLGLLTAARTRGGHYRFPAEETRRAAGRTAARESTHRD